MGFFDGLPVPPDKPYLREELAKIDEGWSAARFDSLPHVVHILTSKDREGEVQYLKEQNDVVEDVVDEVVHAYHGGFNKAIQNYSQILRLFSESAESIKTLKIDLAEAQERLGARNKQLHQLWYRSVTLRHIIALLDQIESISKVPARIEKLIAEKQFYATVQVHVQSALMLDREGLQTVGALQDIRSELSKLRGVIFYQILEELHLHLYNKGKYSSIVSSMDERDDELPTTTAVVVSMSNSQSLSRRTRLMRGDNQLVDGTYRPGSIDGSSFDGHDEESSLELNDEIAIDGHSSSMRNGDVKIVPRLIPSWLSSSTPDEFVEAIRKSDAPEHVKYLQTMVECLCLLGKVAAAGAMISQRLRTTIHDIITSKIKLQAQLVNSLMSASSHPNGTKTPQSMKDHLDGIKFSKYKRQSRTSVAGDLSSVSPVSPVMSPSGKAQTAAKELLDSILDTVVKILENHVIVGELLESKFSQNVNMNTPRSLTTDAKINTDSEASQATGGFSIGFSLTVFQSECQQLICEILRATPEAASADSAVQTARLPSKGPSKEKKEGSEDGLAFSFRFADATVSVSNQGSDLVRQGWSRRGPSVSQEGYGSAAVLPEQGIYLAASIYRPVLQFANKVAALIPKQYSSRGSDALLTFVEKFVKDHFLPTMFGDYRKGVQQAISKQLSEKFGLKSELEYTTADDGCMVFKLKNPLKIASAATGPAAFRPRAHPSAIYTSSVEKGRPVLQGLLAIDFLAKEVLGWARAMPKFSSDLVKFVQSFLERTYERCRTSYMEAVLEKQSYMLIGRHNIEKLMRLDPASACLPHSIGPRNSVNRASDIESIEIESELNELLLNLRPIRQENLIRDDNKLILLACLSDSLEYIAESMESLSQSSNQVEEDGKSLASFADDYRKLAIDCLKVMRIEMQLETIFYLQEMTNREYLDDQDAEEPDDFIVSLTAQITRRDEEMAPFVEGVKRNYIFGGICGIAANTSIKALADMKSIKLFGVQQICRNSIALEQALAAIPSVDSESVQQRLDHVRTYYELLNMPFEALLAFITEHAHLYTASEYANLLKVQVPGREVPPDALDRVSNVLSR